MIIPIKIINMATNVLLLIFSDKKSIERSGTKIYPKDSKIGMSFRLIPYFSPKTLIRVEPKKMV